MTKERNTVNRRRFLGKSAVTGLGLALGAPALWPAAGEKGASKTTYRIGVIGSSGRGDYGHGLDTAWFDFPHCQLVAVADDNPEGLSRAASRLKVKETYGDYRELLDRVKPDIACICPRWMDQHRDMAVAAAERGIHVYMEKPFCRTLKEADEIVAACESTGAKLALALWTRYSPKLETLQRLIQEGAIGKVLEYRARGKEDHRGGGEDLWVLGIHMMDIIRAIGGQPKWCFARVTHQGKPVTKSHVVEGKEGIGPLAGDAVCAMYGMPDASTSYFSSQRNARGDPWRFALQIYGSRGILEIQEGILPPVKYLADPSWCPGRSGAQWQDVSSAGIGQPEPLRGPQYKARHALAIRDLLQSIEADRQPLCNAVEARGATEMIAAVFDSHRLGRPVSLPLKTRENPLSLLR